MDLSSTVLSESFCMQRLVRLLAQGNRGRPPRLTRVVLLGGVTPACVSGRISEIGFGGGVKCLQA